MTGIDPQDIQGSDQPVPFNEESFRQIRVIDTWRKYHKELTWGKGQCLAILDDGCDLSAVQWQTIMPWGPKVITAYNSINDNSDASPILPGYHGTTVGNPSSYNHDGVRGIAYNNHVAHVRVITATPTVYHGRLVSPAASPLARLFPANMRCISTGT
jgi:hypothetical protein